MFVYRGDLHVPGLDLWLDPARRRRLAFVSHAHGDHIGRHEDILATRETARLMEHRLGPQRVRELRFGEVLELKPGFEICLHPAGHVLGAAQIEIRHRGRTLVYTGDFRFGPSPTAGSATVVPCDMLVMECTFGRPHYRFPPREEVLPRLVEELRGHLAAGRTPVLLAYALGRSQELLKLLEPHELPIQLAPPIHAVVRVYEGLGLSFGRYELARPGSTDGSILMLPPHASRSKLVKRAREPVLIAATGWAMDGADGPPYPVDRCFPFSDHADFDQLVRYVQESGAKEVYTLHGFSEFREHLKQMGISAHPVEARVAMQ